MAARLAKAQLLRRLEPVYTGKMMAGLPIMVRHREFETPRRGVPAYSASMTSRRRCAHSRSSATAPPTSSRPDVYGLDARQAALNERLARARQPARIASRDR